MMRTHLAICQRAQDLNQLACGLYVPAKYLKKTCKLLASKKDEQLKIGCSSLGIFHLTRKIKNLQKLSGAIYFPEYFPALLSLFVDILPAQSGDHHRRGEELTLDHHDMYQRIFS